MNRLRYHLGRLARRMWHHTEVVLYHCRLAESAFPLVAARCALRIEPVTDRNVRDAAAMEPAFRIRQFREFLARGELGFFAYRDNQVIHRSWVQLGPRVVQQHYDFAPYELAAGEAYIHFCETAPAARGHGVYPAVLSHILGVLRDRGLQACYIATRANNVASCRGILKAGFREYRRTRIDNCLGRTRLTITPSCAAP